MSLTNLGVVCYPCGGHEGLVLAQHVPVRLLQHALVVGAGLLHSSTCNAHNHGLVKRNTYVTP